MQQQSLRKTSAGFTLIELLLVVAVMAALVAFGLSAYRERTLTAKAERVALQMQQILQAGANYYVQNNCWPVWVPNDIPSLGEPKCPVGVPAFVNYMPVGLQPDISGDTTCTNISKPIDGCFYNPFAKSGSANSPRFFRYEYRPAGQGNRFQVSSGKLPDQQFANRVAALLPNSQVLWDGGGSQRWIVDAEVAMPGTQFQPPFILAGMGMVGSDKSGRVVGAPTHDDSGNPAVIFTCPVGYLAMLTLSMQDFVVGDERLYIYRIRRFNLNTKNNNLRDQPNTKNCSTITNPDGFTTTTCYPSFFVAGGVDSASDDQKTKNIQAGEAWMYYIAACCRSGTPGCRQMT